MLRKLKVVGLMALFFWAMVAFLLALAGAAYATDFKIHTDEIDVLQTCAATCATGFSPTGQSTDAAVAVFQVNGCASVTVQFGFTGTVAGQIENSIDGGVTWTAVTNGSFTGTTSSPQKFVITDPTGWYRLNETTCTSCTLSTRYYATPRGLH